MYRIVERNNPLHLHAICGDLEGARYWINTIAPLYCEKGFFMDKTLTHKSFMIIDKNGDEVK